MASSITAFPSGCFLTDHLLPKFWPAAAGLTPEAGLGEAQMPLSRRSASKIPERINLAARRRHSHARNWFGGASHMSPTAPQRNIEAIVQQTFIRISSEKACELDHDQRDRRNRQKG